MGELGITITDLGQCKECGFTVPMMFEEEKTGWFIACGHRKCEHKTEHHIELLDAADAWGLV